MARVIADRMTAQVEGDFVVFLIGMRINRFWKFISGFRLQWRCRECYANCNKIRRAAIWALSRGSVIPRFSCSIGALSNIWRGMRRIPIASTGPHGRHSTVR